ncbi:hypothetical protein M8J75_014711 [Diaphorina citri]|nr:hypothetical protein M8J75_014711 [Diaphorina citri]
MWTISIETNFLSSVFTLFFIVVTFFTSNCILISGIGLSDSLDSACSELHTVLSSDLCKDLASCYISLAQTYKDNKQYNLAVDYFNKELRLHARNFPEAVKTLGEIGDLYELQEKSFEIVQSTHEKALDLARQNKDDKLIRTVMRSMKKLYKKHDKFTELERIKTELKSLEEKLDLNSSSDEEDTMLEGSPNIGDDINLEELSDLNSGDEESETALHVAAARGNLTLVQSLLKQGHPVKVQDSAGWLPLHEAANHGHTDIVQALVSAGADPNDKGGTGISPLHDAAANGYLEVIEILLDKGASTAQKTNLYFYSILSIYVISILFYPGGTGISPLHDAAANGYLEVMEILLDKGASTAHKTNLYFYSILSIYVISILFHPGGTGISPLHDAAANGYLEVIEILLDKGASTAQKTNQGETALALLQECKARVERTQGSLDPAVEAHFGQVVRKLRVPDELTGQQSVGRTQQPSESNRTQLESRRRESVRGLEMSTPKRSERESRGLSLRNRRELSPSPGTPGDLRDRSLSPISLQSSPNSPKNRNDVCNLGSSSEEESATREYQKAISNLRSHTVKNHTFGKPAQVKVRERQFLEDTEVGDDWLEKDVEVGNGKKRKYYKDGGQGRDEVEPKRVRNNETRKPDALRYEPSSSRKSDSPRFEPSSRKSDSPNKLATLPPRIPEVVRRKSNSPPRQLAIVSRAYEPSQMFCPEDMGDLEPVLTRAESNEYLNRADNVATMSGFNTHLSRSNTNLASSRDRLSGCTAQNTFPNTCNPPISSIKIKIESHVFLIPILNDHHAGEKKISWLKQEASERYYRLEGVTPVLRIKTQDGALVDDNDPLASVLTEALVHTEVIAWNKPPLTERYNQLCTEHGVSTHKHFVHALSNSDTPRFTICTCAKSTPMLLTLFRTILHWTDLVELHLARSFLQDDDVKVLSENLKNLSKLQKLNLSCNRVSHLGLKYLSEQCASVRQLRDLDVSFNPLTNAALPHINNMVASCPLSTLNLSHTGITRLDSNLNLYNIESITISRNRLGAQEVRKLLSLLNADLLVHLNLSATLETPTTSLLEKPRGNVSSNAHEKRSPCKSPNLYFQSDKTSRDEDDLNLPDIISMVPRNSPNKDNTNILVENQTKCTITSQDVENCANKINTDKPNTETSDKPKISNIDDNSQKELDRILNSSPIMDIPGDNINIQETALSQNELDRETVSENELDQVLNSSPIMEMPRERSNFNIRESAGFQNELDRVLNSSPIMEMPHEPRNGNANSANMLKSHRNHGNANSANVKSRPSQDAVPRSPGITREVCLFLEQSERIRLKSLSLCDIDMTDEEASMLYNVLKTVTSITRLDVSNRCLSQRSVELLKSVVMEAD